MHASAVHEWRFINALREAGCTVVENHEAVGTVGSFVVLGMTFERLRDAMSATQYISQGEHLFPSNEGRYYVEYSSSPHDTVFGVFEPRARALVDDGWFFQFSGY